MIACLDLVGKLAGRENVRVDLSPELLLGALEFGGETEVRDSTDHKEIHIALVIVFIAGLGAEHECAGDLPGRPGENRL